MTTATHASPATIREANAPQYVPLEQITKPNLTTAETAYYLNRAPQTLRCWAMNDGIPGLRPLRVNGLLAWPTAQLRALIGVNQGGFTSLTFIAVLGAIAALAGLFALVPEIFTALDLTSIGLLGACANGDVPEVGAAHTSVPPNVETKEVRPTMLSYGDCLANTAHEHLQGAIAAPKSQTLLNLVSVTDVFQRPAPPPLFVWDDYLPRGVVTLMGAHGGTGKSTIALMLATVATLGYPLFGIKTVACKTLFVSLEDSPQIVRYRLAAICRALNIDPVVLGDRLHVVDGTEHPELYSAKGRDDGCTTATYYELSALVKSHGVRLVVVDNASDAYGADEIQRRQVRAFVRTLTLLARLTDAAVLLLSHVDKNTSRNGKANGGEGYSGSTAWHNSVRSRLFLSRADNGTLTLEHQKANLGKKREPLFLEWLDDGFPQLKSGNVKRDGNVAGAADHEHAIALLKLIAEFESREKYCSPAPTARNNPYSLLKSEPSFIQLNLGSDDTKRIVTQCDRNKWLATVTYRSVDRKTRQQWTVTPEGRAIAGLVALTALTAPTCQDSAQDELSAGGAPTAPTGAGGMGEGSAQNIEDVSAAGGQANCLTAPSQSVVVDGQIAPRTSQSDLEPSANQERTAKP